MNLDQAISGFDIETYLEKMNAVPLSASEWIMFCPHCYKKKLAVNVDKMRWHCWVCQTYRRNAAGKRVPVEGAGGVVSLIMWLEGISKYDAIEKIKENSVGYGGLSSFDADGLNYLSNSSGVTPTPTITPLDPWYPADTNLTYVRQRGITEEDVRVFGLHVCLSGRDANRLIFPVWEEQRLVYYQARAMWEKEQETRGNYIKALNPPNALGGVKASQVLMNLDLARHHTRVAIVEGPMDCIRTGPSAVCTFGKHISPAQILKLKQAGVKAIDLMWDGPSNTEPHGAWPEMIRAAADLSGIFDDVKLVFLPQGDPGDYTRRDLFYFRSQSKTADQFSRLAMF